MTGPEDREKDVIIVGAGPVGSYAAYRLALLGKKVTLLDRKRVIGSPIQCAGLVNVSAFDLPGLPDIYDRVVLKEISGADVFSPSGKVLPLRGGRKKAVSIDRSLFDREILLKAVREGVDIRSGTEVVSVDPYTPSVTVRTDDGISVLEGTLVLGCDGPASVVRRCAGLRSPRETAPGLDIEVEIPGAKVPPDRVAVFTGNDVAKGFFAWAVPSRGTRGLRIGLSARTGMDVRRGVRNLLTDERLASFLSLEEISPGSVSTFGWVYGGVPMGQPAVISKGRTLLLGDSAGMAKATSGGGIFPGLSAVDLLSDAMTGSISTEEALKIFSVDWKKGYGRELTRGMVLRRVVRELSDADIEKAVVSLKEERKLEVINGTGDIDHPVSLAVRLIRMDPSLLMLVPGYLPLLKGLLK